MKLVCNGDSFDFIDISIEEAKVFIEALVSMEEDMSPTKSNDAWKLLCELPEL